MFDVRKLQSLIDAEAMARFKGDLVLDLPKGSYTIEEMWEMAQEMMGAAAAVRAEIRHHFQSLTQLEQARLFDELVPPGSPDWQWWFDLLLADEDPMAELLTA